MHDFPMLFDKEQITNYLRIFKLNADDILRTFLQDFNFLMEQNRTYSKLEFAEIVVNYSGRMKTIIGCSVFVHLSNLETVKKQ